LVTTLTHTLTTFLAIFLSKLTKPGHVFVFGCDDENDGGSSCQPGWNMMKLIMKQQGAGSRIGGDRGTGTMMR